MRKYTNIVFLALQFFTVSGFSQTPDTIKITAARGEAMRLNLQWASENHGLIQWQQSRDDSTWTNIPSANVKYYRFNADTTEFYRAQVISGTCNPFYSSVTAVTVANIKTTGIDSITDHEAVIECSADFSNIKASEWGILLDTISQPEYQKSSRYSREPSVQGGFRLAGLNSGKIYYACVYVKLTDNHILRGNILKFRTLKISFNRRVNATDSTVSVWYSIAGDTVDALHGVFYSSGSLPDTTSDFSPGINDGSLSRALLEGLDASETYYIIPWIKVFGRYVLGESLAVTTSTDYSGYVQDTTAVAVRHKISWKAYATATQISQPGTYADYGRIRRIGTSDTLVLVYHGGPNNQDWINIYMRRSFDNGITWENQRILADVGRYSNYWRFCNPELIVLKSGTLMLAYAANGKPETNENCYIHLLTSSDRGESWEGPVLIQTGRSWEPSMVQLPGGEIELFYSSEARWWPADQGEYIQQEIHRIRSNDNGQTWSYPETVAWYPGRRDGMPVPLLLGGNRGVVFAIETVNSATSPYIVSRDLADDWTLTSSGFENGQYRWLSGYFNGHGGAPYIISLPGGETALSVHVYRGGDWHQNNYMQVMIGDKDARNFSNISTPWGVLPSNESAVNNSLFLKNDTTIVAVSGRNFRDGHGGIYWLEGEIVPVQ